MKRLLLFTFLTWFSQICSGQLLTETYDTLLLPSLDTYYVNYSAPGTDVGFNVFPSHYPCVYDTFGGLNYWRSGFVYSNRTDSMGYPNLYSAKPLRGHDSSSTYLVVNGINNAIIFPQIGSFANEIWGIYITNTTYGYNSMKYGDAFARKFGDSSGTRPDWFKVTIKGYTYSGRQTGDSVDFYLADFRNDTSSRDYIVKDWKYVRLGMLGFGIDSMTFKLTSSDEGAFGMNTPAFFCIDDLSFSRSFVKINTLSTSIAKTYPNPATNELNLDILDKSINTAAIYNLSGHCVLQTAIHNDHTTISLTNLPAGIYTLHLSNGQQVGVSKFQKL